MKIKEQTWKQVTRSGERMLSDFEWLKSRHSFSFGGHHDPERMGFGPLRVVNDDIVAPEGGFPAHPHRDMEIVSIVLDGELQHQDSLGNGRVIKAGEVQYMSAGAGVVHSEFNPSSEKPAHFMQIWIEPERKGMEPKYADQPLVGAEDDAWSLILSPDGRDGSVGIRQDATLKTVRLTPGNKIGHETDAGTRGLWAFVIEGSVSVDGEIYEKGDSVAFKGIPGLELANTGSEPAKVLLFDLPV